MLTKLKQGGSKIETKLKQTSKNKIFEVNLTNNYPILSRTRILFMELRSGNLIDNG
jgi:hypothetical protein